MTGMRTRAFISVAVAKAEQGRHEHAVIPTKVLAQALLALNAAEQMLAMRGDGNWKPRDIVEYLESVFKDIE